MPGEVSQEIGRAYVYVLSGCLHRCISGFEPLFDVYTSPEKVSFVGNSGASYSFDSVGAYDDAEVLIEYKGYSNGDGLLASYREFLEKAYCTSVQFSRHSHDDFWFVTNVPFASKAGREIVSPKFVRDTLTSMQSRSESRILGETPIDDGYVRRLCERLAVVILTDSFIKLIGIRYRVRSGDSVWRLVKRIHGGRIPGGNFGYIESQVRDANRLEDAGHIQAGQLILLPWYGMAK